MKTSGYSPVQKFLILDGNSLLNRAHFALGVYNRLTAPDGRPTAAVYGFFSSLISWIKEFSPDYMFVAWDTGKTFRHEIYSSYKGGRPPMDDDLREQFPITKDILDKMGIKNFGRDDFEADDLIGSLAKIAVDEGKKVVVISGDRDLYQLISPEVTVVRPSTKSGQPIQYYMDPASFQDEYEFPVERFVDFRALVGDSSDALPGVKGIGEKSATKLMQEYKSLDEIYEHLDELRASWKNKLEAGKDDAFLTKKLSAIVCDLDFSENIEDFSFRVLKTKELNQALEELDLKSIINRWSELAPGMPNEAEVVKSVKRVKQDVEEVKNAAVFAKLVKNKSLFFLRNDELGEQLEHLEGEGYFLFDQEGNYYNLTPDTPDNNICDLLRSADEVLTYGMKSKLREFSAASPDLKFFDFKIAAYLLAEGIELKQDLQELLKEKHLDGEPLLSALSKLRVLYDDELKTKGMRDLAYDVELPLTELLERMELAGVTIDSEALAKYKSELENRIDKLETEIFAYAEDEFNLNSSRQLAEVLFEKLQLPVGKKTKSGYGSTAAEELIRLKGVHPIIDPILEYRTLAKLLQGFVMGLEQSIAEDGKIHTHFKQTLTSTGRLSSANPNLQNIPVRSAIGREIRKVFAASSGKLLLSADYSQIELRLLAEFSKDEVLLKAFKEDKDIHLETARKLFPEKTIGPRERAIAKTVNFSIIYGISAFSLSKDLDLSVADAKAYIDSYHDLYPGVLPWLENQKQKAKDNGFVTTMLGRRRAIPDINSRNYPRRQYAERQAMNAPVQGSAADLIKLAMVKLDKAFRNSGLDAKIILQIHDELIIEVSENDLQQAAEILHREMLNAYELDIPLETSLEYGKNWSEMEELEL